MPGIFCGWTQRPRSNLVLPCARPVLGSTDTGCKTPAHGRQGCVSMQHVARPGLAAQHKGILQRLKALVAAVHCDPFDFARCLQRDLVTGQHLALIIADSSSWPCQRCPGKPAWQDPCNGLRTGLLASDQVLLMSLLRFTLGCRQQRYGACIGAHVCCRGKGATQYHSISAPNSRLPGMLSCPSGHPRASPTSLHPLLRRVEPR